MKKTWNKIILIFLILFIIELIAGAIILLPHFKLHKIYNGIEQGKWKSVKEQYDKLSESQKEEIQSNLDGYANSLCKKYYSGDKEYIDIAASMDAVNVIDKDGAIYNKYMEAINEYEFMRAVDEFYKADVNYDTKGSFDVKNSLNAVSQRMDSETRDRLLVRMLNDKYSMYLNEKMSFEEIGAFATIVSGLSYDTAYEYVNVIINNTTSVDEYRKLYSEGQRCNEQNKFFTTMSICKNVTLDPNDTIYKEKFDKLYTSAYVGGKMYYKDRLDSLIADKENEKALDLMSTLYEYYGEDFDITAEKKKMAAKWQKQYIDLVANPRGVNVGLTSESADNGSATGTTDGTTTEGTGVSDAYKEAFDGLKPDSFALYDIDTDGVPELFLFNGKNNDSKCMILSSGEDSCTYLGMYDIEYFCQDSYVITRPLDSAAGSEAYALGEFSDNTITITSVTVKADDKYYVNSALTNDVDFLTAQNDILNHSNGKTTKDIEKILFNVGESYILAYK